jgi:hypothetical protein
MANTKRKPEETPKRSPGKSKFVFPKREAPPVDNTYFDRLFNELQGQKLDSDLPTQIGEAFLLEEPNPTLVDVELSDHAVLKAKQSIPLSHTAEIPSDEQFSQDMVSEPIRLEIAPKKPKSKQSTSVVSSSADEQELSVYCKPETSSYVDQLKLKYRLSKGEANVFRYLLGATHDKSQVECYIAISKLAEAARLTKRGCQLALKNLQIRGLIVRTEEYDPVNKLGIKIQVNLISI